MLSPMYLVPRGYEGCGTVGGKSPRGEAERGPQTADRPQGREGPLGEGTKGESMKGLIALLFLWTVGPLALPAPCGGAPAPAGPHDPYMGVVVDWTALTAYADSSTTYPDSFGVRIVARYLRPDTSQLDSLVSSVRFTGAGVGTKCVGDVAGS